jgi:hypothetical protein
MLDRFAARQVGSFNNSEPNALEGGGGAKERLSKHQAKLKGPHVDALLMEAFDGGCPPSLTIPPSSCRLQNISSGREVARPS